MTRAQIEGTITRLNHIIDLPNGDKLRNIVVACNYNDLMVYHDVILFNELTNVSIQKSQNVYVEGILKYKRKNENKYSEIIAEVINVKS